MMITIRHIGATLALLSSTALLATTQRPRMIWIDHIEMRLVYANNVTLSENIAKPSEFMAWNTIIGEGEAKAPADDVLVTVHLGAIPSSRFEPISIIAKDGTGKIVGKRNAVVHSSPDEEGKAVVSLMLYDVTCAGRLTVTARMGRSSSTNTADLACGE
jgi:hypothetical protein